MKSIRDGRVNIKEAYVIIRNGEIFIVGMHLTPLSTAPPSIPDPTRTRKLLLRHNEIMKLIGRWSGPATLVPLTCTIPGPYRPRSASPGQETVRQAGRRPGEGRQARSLPRMKERQR